MLSGASASPPPPQAANATAATNTPAIDNRRILRERVGVPFMPVISLFICLLLAPGACAPENGSDLAEKGQSLGERRAVFVG